MLRTVAARARRWSRTLIPRARAHIATLPQRNGGWPVLVALAVILALGLALRIDSAAHPLGKVAAGPDAHAYETIAEALYNGVGFGYPTHQGWGIEKEMSEPYKWSPGTPIMVAGLYVLRGKVDVEFALIMIAILGALTVWLIYLLARRLAGPIAGLLAALFAAVYPAFVYDNSRLMSEGPAEFTLVASLLAFLWVGDRRRTWLWILPGLLMGLTAFIRPEYLAFCGLFALLALIRVWRDRGFKLGVAAAVVYGLAGIAVIAPWTVHVSKKEDRFVPISTGGGMALFVGSYLPADGLHYRVKEELIKKHRPQYRNVDKVPWPVLRDTDWNDLIGIETRGKHHLPRDQALQQIGRKNLIHYVTTDPIGYAGMFVRKIGRTWQGVRRPRRSLDPGFERPIFGTLWVHSTGVKVFHYTLIAVGLIGLGLLALRRRWEAVVLGLPIVGISVLAGVLLASTRRSVVLMPIIISLAGAAIVMTTAWVQAFIERRRSASASGGIEGPSVGGNGSGPGGGDSPSPTKPGGTSAPAPTGAG